MFMSIATGLTLHGVKRIMAHTPATLGAPLILSLLSTDQQTGTITIFLDDQALADRLVDAINGAAKHKCEPDPEHEAAHDAAAYAYRGSHR